MTAAELRELVKDYRRYHLLGGPLHIVLEDENIETHFIEWCLDTAEEWYRDWYDPVYQEAHAPIADLLEMTRILGAHLLAASKTQRSKAVAY